MKGKKPNTLLVVSQGGGEERILEHVSHRIENVMSLCSVTCENWLPLVFLGLNFPFSDVTLAQAPSPSREQDSGGERCLGSPTSSFQHFSLGNEQNQVDRIS